MTLIAAAGPLATPTVSAGSLPTVVLHNILEPRITPAPTTSCPPNTLIVQLSTTLVIPDFSTFYSPTPIQLFVPTYTGLPDGTLLTPAFMQDQQDSNLSLFITGVLAMLFVRNILVSGDYLRRNKVKKKKLFYALFLSQILAPLALVPVILSYFSQPMSCTAIIVLSCLSGTTSLAVLITGILGVKVYKCMNNRRFILVILGLFQALSTTVVVFDVITTRGIRRLTGSCIRTDDLRFTRYFVILQFLESLFICICFVFVCWKSRGNPAARGRISLELSMDDLPIEFPTVPSQPVQPTRRGWWDYVPENPIVPPAAQTNVLQGPQFAKPNIFMRFVDKLTGSNSRGPPLNPLINEKGFKLSKRARKRQYANPQANNAQNNSDARLSLAPSATSKFSRIGMELFRQVMKDELLYTTFITFNLVVVAILVIIGVNFKNGLSVTGWIALNWALVSLLAIHSFGRVVHRHERDALLSHPVTCNAIVKVANELVSRNELNARKRTLSRPSTLKNLRISSNRTTQSSDPFADTQPLEPNAPLTPAQGYQETPRIAINDRSSQADPFADDQALERNVSLMSALGYQGQPEPSSIFVGQAFRVQDSRTPPRLSDSHFPSSPREDFSSNLGTPNSIVGGFVVQQEESSRRWIGSASSASDYSHTHTEHATERRDAR